MATSFERLLLGLQPQQPPDDGPLPEEPEELRTRQHPAWSRRLAPTSPLAVPRDGYVSAEESRALLDSEAKEYAEAQVTNALIVQAPPGAGKTTIAVKHAEGAAAKGWRVLYLGPRHDFFQDLMRLAQHPDWWYEWLPRQKGDEHTIETCKHAEAIASWLYRGYRAFEFCKGVCGFESIATKCPYHAQSRTKARIIFGQHQHLFTGHPLRFHLLIGDECPMMAACREWVIPTKYMVPPQMPTAEPLTELLFDMQKLSEEGMTLQGPTLLAALGGVERVREIIESSKIPSDAVAAAPHIHRAEQAQQVSFFHLPDLVHLLAREAGAAMKGADYPHRVIVTGNGLILLLPRRVNDKLPAKKVWLDATAEPRLYQAVLNQPVQVVAPRVKTVGKIIQVYDRANGKASFTERDGSLNQRKVAEIRKQVMAIASRYKKVGLITHMALKDEFPEIPTDLQGHFFAERGTNKFGEVDCLIVVGTPQPPLHQIDKLARMIFWERMEPFDTRWTARVKAYDYIDPDESLPWDKRGRAYPASGYWDDEDLAAMLWQYREAELIQAVHRARPLLREVDVWLLANLPVDELPVSRLLSIHELMGAPGRLDALQWWPDVKMLADQCEREGVVLTTRRMMDHVEGLPERTARKYLKHILEDKGRWSEVTAAEPTRRGRPGIGAFPLRSPFSMRAENGA